MAQTQTFMTDDLKNLIGTSLTGQPDYIERNDIRLFAEAIRIPNSPRALYTDEVYARGTRYGGVIAPPTYLTRLARRGGFPWAMALPEWLQERTAIGAGNILDIEQPLRPGDIIFTDAKVTNIYERQGPNGNLIFLVREFQFKNQLGQYVGRIRRCLMKFAEGAPCDCPEVIKQEAGFKFDTNASSSTPSFSNKVTLMELNQFAAGNREWGRYHMDRDFAQSLGLKDVLVTETLKTAYIANMFEEWLGDDLWIQRLSTFYPVMDYVGDTLVTKACVTDRSIQNGRKYLDCDVWIENQRGDVGTVGTARLIVPENVEA